MAELLLATLPCIVVPILGTLAIAACVGRLGRLNVDPAQGATARLIAWYLCSVLLAAATVAIVAIAVPFGVLGLLVAPLFYLPIFSAVVGGDLAAVAAARAEDVYKFVQRRRRETRIRSNHCVHCNYDLRGSPSGRCPECGHDHVHGLTSADDVR